MFPKNLMWNEIDVLRDVTQRLNSGGIPFMLTGSLAMNHYATPRMTRDIDLVLQLPLPLVKRLAEVFTPDYYLVEEAIQEAISHESIFNLIHEASVLQIDCIICKSSPYRKLEFSRRQKVMILDFETWIVSKEDLILSKLFWAKESRSETQLRDIRALVATGYDMDYLQSCLRELGVLNLWEEWKL